MTSWDLFLYGVIKSVKPDSKFRDFPTFIFIFIFIFEREFVIRERWNIFQIFVLKTFLDIQMKQKRISNPLKDKKSLFLLTWFTRTR